MTGLGAAAATLLVLEELPFPALKVDTHPSTNVIPSTEQLAGFVACRLDPELSYS
jgi:hypothetical protein